MKSTHRFLIAIFIVLLSFSLVFTSCDETGDEMTATDETAEITTEGTTPVESPDETTEHKSEETTGEITEEIKDAPEVTTEKESEVTTSPAVDVTTAPAEETTAPVSELTNVPAEETTEPIPEETTQAPHEHVWSSWNTVISAACTAEGKQERACSCGETESKTIAAVGHSEVIDKAVSATCTTDGKTEGKHCKNCGTVTVKQDTVKALGHSEVIDEAIAPTCTESGKTEGKHCSVCNEVTVKQTLVDALGHNEVIDEAIAPTCTESGKTEGKHCAHCNTIIVKQDTIKPLEHKPSNWVIESKSTCYTEGKKYQICSVCNGTLNTELIDCIPHNYQTTISKKNCKSNASTIYTCTVCQYSYSTPIYDIVASINRTAYDEGWGLDAKESVTYSIIVTQGIGECSYKYEVFTNEAYATPLFTTDFSKTSSFTMTENAEYGTPDRKVLRITIKDEANNQIVYSIKMSTERVYFGNYKTEIMNVQYPAGEHEYSNWIVDKEETCTTDGNKYKICSICNDKAIEAIPLKGHAYIISSMSNNGVIGSKVIYTCTNCVSIEEKIVEDILINVEQTGSSSATINGYGSYSKSYKVNASGGLGTLKYKFEIFSSTTATKPNSNLTKEYSTDNTYCISYKGYEDAIREYILKVTVQDEFGNTKVYDYSLLE